LPYTVSTRDQTRLGQPNVLLVVVHQIKTLSEEQQERIEIDIDNNNSSFEESFDMAEPQEIIREEVVEVVEIPSLIIFINHYCHQEGDIYEQVKVQSIHYNLK